MGACATLLACARSGSFDTDDAAAATDAGHPADAGTTCQAALTACGALCADLTKDPSHCGACATKCQTGQFCAASKCSDACNKPQVLCGQFCVDLMTDHDNCGKCGMGCAVNQECKGGACQKICPAGLTLCDPDCVDVISDPNHCGDCNTACAQNEYCTGSLCCANGLSACNGQCTNLQQDDDNCGQCGNACGGTFAHCVSGTCQAVDPSYCAANPKWTPVSCTTGQWVWSSDRSKATTVTSASQQHLLWSGCQHSSIPSTCSLTGTGWVSTQTFSMSGCNASWYHLGGSYTGNCGGHDGDQVRHLAMGPNDCWNY